jgi:hypothetical protein
MDSSNITPEQANILLPPLRRDLRFLTRLRRRMELRAFPPRDHLYQRTLAAEESVHALCVEMHYRAVAAAWDGKIASNCVQASYDTANGLNQRFSLTRSGRNR